MAVKAQKKPLLNEGDYTVEKVNELNFFDLSGKKANTKGTSNKTYHAELQKAKSGTKVQIYTMYGATGSVQASNWRYYNDLDVASKDYERILKSKRKKGYKDIDVAQRALGSDNAKSITKAVQLNNSDHLTKSKDVSKLDLQTQELMTFLFGATQNFVSTTLKCPLGQLTNIQIDDGRSRLDKAKKIINAKKKLTKKNKDEIEKLTNDFYGLIPHNFGAGARGQMSHLLLDTLDKIMQKEDDLDTLLDAKSVGAVLNNTSGVDEKYKTLNADISAVPRDNPMFSFIANYYSGSQQRAHGYTNTRVKNVWSVSRKDKESDYFISNVEKISKKCNGYNYIKEANRLYRNATQYSLSNREDLDLKALKLYKQANVWMCWHGTRSANIIGITKRGLLIRPSGAIHTGSMYGDGKYYSHQSSKSLNYCDGGYWARNKGKQSKYMFILDVALGNMYTANGPSFYKSAPKGYHSVYGKAGKSGVMNDEMITYDFKPEQCQGIIKYLLEIS